MCNYRKYKCNTSKVYQRERELKRRKYKAALPGDLIADFLRTHFGCIKAASVISKRTSTTLHRLQKLLQLSKSLGNNRLKSVT